MHPLTRGTHHHTRLTFNKSRLGCQTLTFSPNPSTDDLCDGISEGIRKWQMANAECTWACELEGSLRDMAARNVTQEVEAGLSWVLNV